MMESESNRDDGFPFFTLIKQEEGDGGGGSEDVGEGGSDQGIAVMFFQWLESNKDLVSAEDLRSIKLKTSTVEWGVKRLGGGREGMRRLLELILEWIQNHQLEKRSIREEAPPNPNPNPNSNPNNRATHSALLPHAVPPIATMSFRPCRNTVSCQLYPSPHDQLVKSGTSSSKEARKNRMAKRKRVFSHMHSYIDHEQQQVHDTRLVNESKCTNTSQLPNWQLHCPIFPWINASPSTVLGSEPPPPLINQGGQKTAQSRQYHRQTSLYRKQVCKPIPETNLKLLVKKVLKQSDVSSLGRIVLPKKEAEAFLPNLEGRDDGIIITMEDAGSASIKIWNMCYRLGPNKKNKDRMYLLENTGEFVRSNELREGDFILIYFHNQCGKYIIRGVKVPTPVPKSEA